MRKVGLLSILFVVVLLAVAVIADAQQPKKIYRIGYLSGIDAATHSTRSDTFRQTLRELGYIEGQNIIIEYRYAEGKLDRLPELAAELVRLKVDIVLSSAPPPTRAAKSATATIPIVIAFDDDPVRNGFVATLARPGGNITGLSSLAPEISGKQLEVLKEIVPKLSRVAVLGTSTVPQYEQVVKEIELAAKAFGVEVQYLDVLNAKGIETAFRAANKQPAEAVVVLGNWIYVIVKRDRDREVKLKQQRVRTVHYQSYPYSEFGPASPKEVRIWRLEQYNRRQHAKAKGRKDISRSKHSS
jgi:putative tryptophan/tyrosine transport system substrate-binding protein